MQITPANVAMMPRPATATRFAQICDEYVTSQPHRSEADREVGVMIEMAESIVATVRTLGAQHRRLNHAQGAARWDAWSVATGFVDATDLLAEASAVLTAAVERRIPQSTKFTQEND